MPTWNHDYYNTLNERFQSVTNRIDDRLNDIISGRTAPAVDDIAIGSAKKVRAAAFFFDIRGFSSRTGSADMAELRKTLLMLDCVIPMIMHVIYDYGGYVEKNTGDGVMAVVGVDGSDTDAANSALDIATVCFFLLKNMINPFLISEGVSGVDARIGIDIGNLLLARLGTHTGQARHARNFLTAVGPSANLACRLQERAGTNEIWVGDNIATHARDNRKHFFVNKTPPDWGWHYSHDATKVYHIWHYNAVKTDP